MEGLTYMYTTNLRLCMEILIALLILPWNKRKERMSPLATQLLAYLLSPLKTLGEDGLCSC